ncbi:hypothetical protein [Modestobacter marinus]|uniref:hypothetical protein n=1 Tax=Modestobacter marinus TaxID=477641 RepID=UPI001C94252A|nr:hypothetical protein [Modestobacter marinus]
MRATTLRGPRGLVIIGVVAAVLLAGLGWGLFHPRDAPGLRLGLAGPFRDSSLTAAREIGVSDVLVEVEWRRAEPRQGQLDEEYLRDKAQQVARLRAQGFRIALNTGIQDAPEWLLERPGARFVNQFGDAYTERPVPNLLFGTELRPLAASYLTRLLDRLGTEFSLVRVGGGPLGELSYPWIRNSDGRVENFYWAFDDNAMRANPVPEWRPGMPSDRAEAHRFLTWYLDSLARYQNWQISTLRGAGFGGPVAVLYPSYGMRPGDAEIAIDNNLGGTSAVEESGDVQRGYDFARQVSALTDLNTVIYATWGEQVDVVAYLAFLAHDDGRPAMAENSGANSRDEIDRALRNAADQGLVAFYLVRAEDLTCECNGLATLDDVARTYQSLAESPRRPLRRRGASRERGHGSSWPRSTRAVGCV